MLEAGGHRVLVGGNIGHALSAQVDDIDRGHDSRVEASSFQLETADTFHPWIAVLLNFSPDHLDRHADRRRNTRRRRRGSSRIRPPRTGRSLNADDSAALAMARGRTVAPAAVLDARRAVRGHRRRRRLDRAATAAAREPLVPLSAIRLLGPTPGRRRRSRRRRWRGWPASTPPAMTRAVEGFTGLEHALEPVGEVGGVRFVNDSKATNIEAARRAIESFDDGLVVILGGRFKGGDFRDLREPLAVAAGDGRGDRRSRGRSSRTRWAAAVAGARGGGHVVGGADRVRLGVARAARWCSRRRVRASTCSATTRNAGACSSRKCCGCRRSGMSRVSSEQSSVRSVR